MPGTESPAWFSRVTEATLASSQEELRLELSLTPRELPTVHPPFPSLVVQELVFTPHGTNAVQHSLQKKTLAANSVCDMRGAHADLWPDGLCARSRLRAVGHRGPSSPDLEALAEGSHAAGQPRESLKA